MVEDFTLVTLRGEHRVVAPMRKLAARGSLPGAYGYDLSAHAMRMARARGVSLEVLLPAAMPASWMVNNRAPSPVFRWWLDPSQREAWVTLSGLLEGGPEQWLSLGELQRKSAQECVLALAIQGHGLCALSKVLACLVCESVPLMDDAMLSLCGLAVDEPATADDPRAEVSLFAPVMDWFARSVLTHEETLIALAREYVLAPLDTTQVLDRLLWIESWGWRLAYASEHGRFVRVRDERHRSAVLCDASCAPATTLGPDALSDAERALLSWK